MSSYIPVFYGSYRSDRIGIRLATYIMDGLGKRGENPELIDAKAVGLPMLDRMYKEYPRARRLRPWRNWRRKSALPTPSFS